MVCSISLDLLQSNYFIVSNVIVYLYFVQTDRAAMLDEIVDYVKFLRLQVKVIALVNSSISHLFSLDVSLSLLGLNF